MATGSGLTQLLDAECAAMNKFQPYVEISKESDALTVYFRSDADYSKRLTDHVTLFLSIDSDEIVGCRIKGIGGILEDMPNYLTINHGPVPLTFIFLPFRGTAQDEKIRQAMNELARLATEREMTLEPA